jgi:hypothetical protein
MGPKRRKTASSWNFADVAGCRIEARLGDATAAAGALPSWMKLSSGRNATGAEALRLL